MRVNTIEKTQFMDEEICSGIYFSHVGKKSRCINGKVYHFPFQLVSLQKIVYKQKNICKTNLKNCIFFPLSVSKKKLMWKAINSFLGNVSILYSQKVPETFLFLVLSGTQKWEHLQEIDGKAFPSKHIILDSSVARICLLHKRWVVLAKLFCGLIWSRFP